MQSHNSNCVTTDAISLYFSSANNELDFITLVARKTANNLEKLCEMAEGLISKTVFLQDGIVDGSLAVAGDYASVWTAIDLIHEKVHIDLDMLNEGQIDALRDVDLKAGNETLVVAAFQKSIGQFQKLFDTIESLRWAFLEAEADSHGRDEQTYESVDEFLCALNG